MNLALERWSRSDQHQLNEIMGFDDEEALPTQSDRPIKEVMTIIGLEDDEDLSTIANDTVNESMHMNGIFAVPTNPPRMLFTPKKLKYKSDVDHDTLPETPPKNFSNSLESKSHQDEFNRQWSRRFIRLLCCASILATILLGSIAVLALNLYSIRNSDGEQVESSSIAADGTSPPFDFSYLTESPTITPTSSPTSSPTMLRAIPSPTKSPVTPQATTASPTSAPSLITPSPVTQNLTLGPTSTGFMTVLDTIRESILRASPNSAATLFDEQSVQYNVLEWLVEDPALGNYTEAKILQRFVLATFHGSLSRGMDQAELSPTTANWMTYTDECTWTLTRDQLCDETGKVTSIYLEDLNLKGTLPPELGLLSDSLEKLFLSSNGITGEIPTEIGQLTLLQRMQIPRNNLGGSIPSEIGLLSNKLGVLAFGSNNLIGEVPTELGRLQQLGFLGLQKNSLIGTIPTELSQLTGLRFLSLESNFLSGQVPEGLGDITGLQKLLLQQNELVGLMPKGICQIRELELSADCDEVECDCCSDCCFDCIRVSDAPAVAPPDFTFTEAPTAFTTATSEPTENECVSIQVLTDCYTQDQSIEVAVTNCDAGEFDVIALYKESVGDNISYPNAVFWVTSCGLEECDGIMADGLIYFENQDPGKLGSASWPLSQDSYKMHLLRINQGGEVVSWAESDPFRIDDTC